MLVTLQDAEYRYNKIREDTAVLKCAVDCESTDYSVTTCIERMSRIKCKFGLRSSGLSNFPSHHTMSYEAMLAQRAYRVLTR